jgi:hypothetical protein
MRQAVSRLENEKRSLQEEMGRNESRATKLELQRLSLEGDLQRLQMILQEKDSNIQVWYPSGLTYQLKRQEMLKKPRGCSREVKRYTL